MSQVINHDLSKQPSLASLFSRAVKPKQKAKGELPIINARLKSQKADPKKVESYSKVCGFKGPKDILPASYPHILAFPLQLKILTSDEFPYPLLGLVHVSNEITQYRSIKASESLDYVCSLTGKRDVDKGEEFDIHTEVKSGDEVVWESVSTMLNRSKSGDSGKKTPVEPIDFGAQDTQQWKVPANIGRSYAKVSGDFNFIHLHKITAVLFGFKTAIAHGMWSKAHTLACLEKQLPENGAFKIQVKFKLPMFLPASAQLQSKSVESGNIEFQLMDKTGEKPHLAGSITRV